METKLKQEPVADGMSAICEHHWNDCAPVGNKGVTREYCGLCTMTRSKPVADGGGLPCKLRTDGGTTCAATPCQCHPPPSLVQEIEKHRKELIFENQALRERMQQAVAELEPCVSHYLNQPVRTGITKAISLLSPEGSSR